MIKVLKNSNLSYILENKKYKVVPSRSGRISEVSNKNNVLDWNQSSDDFYYHQDGSHLKSRPSFVALFCVDPGNKLTRTSFVDTNKVYLDLVKSFDRSFLFSMNSVYVDRFNKKFSRPLVEKVGSKFYLNSFSYVEPNLKVIQNKHRRFLPILLTSLLTQIELLKKTYIVYEHSWDKDDLVFYDNKIYQHARVNADPKDKKRKLLRVWLDNA